MTHTPDAQVTSPLIFGCGYLGRVLADLLVATKQTPHCIVATETSLEKLQAKQLSATLVNFDHELTNNNDLKLSNRHVYYFIPPSQNDDQDQRIDRFLQLCQNNVPRRIVYISTSGVYGDCQGEWVDENHPTQPITARAKRRLYAEQVLQDFCAHKQCELMILRVGGIYGAERLPIKRIPEITVIDLAEAPFSNRIHVEDLAQVCHAAMHCLTSNEIINVADGHPTSMTDYYNQIADHAGIARPSSVPLAQAAEKLSPAMYSFINESRRLSVDKMHAILKISLQMPTLEIGLKYCFKKVSNDVNC